MEPHPDTIIALSTGSLPSGVALIRISGNKSEYLLQLMGCEGLEPRKTYLRNINHTQTDDVLDQGLVIFFSGPNSFTGEDCLELHVHGGRAVVSSILDSLLIIEGVRLAEAGEFSRRAFENGRLDLTEIEGLSDLIVAETEAQRKLALSQSQGDLRNIYEEWRKRLIHLRAMIEAELDFSDEEDVPTDISEAGISQIGSVLEEIKAHLDDNAAGEIIRDGYKIALAGKPNSGKSSLLNVLAKREVAIVTSEPGTTRDIIEVNLDISGYAVTIFDTAGIRESDNVVEQEGIRRAKMTVKEADLVIWLKDQKEELPENISDYENVHILFSKDDGEEHSIGDSISSQTGYGIDTLIQTIETNIKDRVQNFESGLLTRKRYRLALEECSVYLEKSILNGTNDVELTAESLRLASDCIARITGRIDVEDLLDVIFSEFCIGK